MDGTIEIVWKVQDAAGWMDSDLGNPTPADRGEGIAWIEMIRELQLLAKILVKTPICERSHDRAQVFLRGIFITFQQLKSGMILIILFS